MPKDIAIVHHPDRRTDVAMPYAPAIVVRRGQLLFVSGVTAAPVYHSHPHRDEEFDLPRSMREQAMLTMENLRKTLEAAGAVLVAKTTMGELAPLTVIPDVVEVAEKNAVTEKPVSADPPLFSGATNDTVACALPAVALTEVGGLGTVAGTTGAEGAEGGPWPTLLVARTVNV